MTVDMLAATFFWPEGTMFQGRRDIVLADDSETPPPPDAVTDQTVEDDGETFWAIVLRQVGWPLPRLS